MTGPASPPVEDPRPARRIGAATVVVGALVLLTATGYLVWALAQPYHAGYGNHFGLGALAPLLFAAHLLGALALGSFGALYLGAGLRAYRRGARTWGLRISGHTSLWLAAFTVCVMCSTHWRTSDSPLWHIVATAMIIVFGSHCTLMFASWRPAAPRNAAAWSIAGVTGVIVGVILIARSAPPPPGEIAVVEVPGANR